MKKWTSAIERCVLGHVAPGRSPTLVWALIGLKVHPQFQALLQGLRNLKWQKMQQKHLKLDVYITPVFANLLNQISWNADAQGNLITAQGTISFETDSFQSILGFAQQSWLWSMWKVDKRVSHLEKSQFPDLQILSRASRNLDQVIWQRETALTGAGVDGRMLSKFHKTEITCFCHISNPTRRHLTWHCESFANQRCVLFSDQEKPDRDSAAEGLLVLSRPLLWQIQPFLLLQQGLQILTPEVQHELQIIVESALQNPIGNMCILATDGGSSRCNYCTRGSWAIANPRQAIGGQLQGFDQSSYASEINAVLIVILALEQSLYKLFHDVAILIDNQDVARKLEFLLRKLEFLLHNPEINTSSSWEYPWIWDEICTHLRSMPYSCMHVVWVLSHDKQPDWQAPLCLPTSTCRYANHLADAAASESLSQHAEICFREKHLEIVRAQWMQNAVHLQQDALLALTRKFERMNILPCQGVG